MNAYFFTEFDAIKVQTAETAVKFYHCNASPMFFTDTKSSIFRIW